MKIMSFPILIALLFLGQLHAQNTTLRQGAF